MYRFRVPEIFLGCFLTIAVFAMGMLFGPYPQPPAHQVSATASQSESKVKHPESEPSGWAWLSKDAAGFFTFGLVAVGIGQAILFFIQLRYMRVGMADATMAANASKTSADAAMKSATVSERALTELERPWVFAFGAAVVQTNMVGGWVFEYKVANYGKMPAIIEVANIGLVTSDCGEPPLPLMIDDSHNLVVSPILQAGEQRTLREPIPGDEDGSISFQVLQTASGETLEKVPGFQPPPDFDSFFRVIIGYRGPTSTGHQTSAMWFYQAPFDLLNRGGEDYNYTK
ncbi:MAG: hypothetical protein ABIL01_16130 [Pseudomonadota bacterium]